MTIPFRFKHFTTGTGTKILNVTEDNFLDTLLTLCSLRPRVAYHTIVVFAWHCSDQYDDATMFDTYQGGMGVELCVLLTDFIRLTYPGYHWAEDRDFLYSLLSFIVDKIEVIENTIHRELGITISNHRKKSYEQAASINREHFSKQVD